MKSSFKQNNSKALSDLKETKDLNKTSSPLPPEFKKPKEETQKISIVKKIEFASQVIEISDDAINIRSLSGTPFRSCPNKNELDENTCFPKYPLTVNQTQTKNFSLEKDSSKQTSGQNNKRNTAEGASPTLKITREVKKNSDRFENYSEKKSNFSRKQKNFKSQKGFEKTNRSPHFEGIYFKDKEDVAVNRFKLSPDPVKKLKIKEKKAGKIELKLNKTKKIEEIQSNLYSKRKRASINLILDKSAKAEIANKIKTGDKRKVKTNRAVQKIGNRNPKLKGASELTQENLLLPKNVRFNMNQIEDSDLDIQYTSLSSSCSKSETAEWINLELDEFKGLTSDFVGEFLEKLNDDCKAPKNELFRDSEEAKTKSSDLSPKCISEQFDFKKKKIRSKNLIVPPLKLAHIRQTSESSIYAEEVGVIYDSKDTVFRDLFNQSSQPTSQSARVIT